MYILVAALILDYYVYTRGLCLCDVYVFTRSMWNNNFLFLNFIRTTQKLVLNFYFYYCNGVYNIWRVRLYRRHCPFKTILHFISPSHFSQAINKKKTRFWKGGVDEIRIHIIIIVYVSINIRMQTMSWVQLSAFWPLGSVHNWTRRTHGTSLFWLAFSC